MDVSVEAGSGDVVAEFPFKNEGTSSVTITELAASCGCTAPTVENRVVPAGGRGVIKAVFATGDRTGPQAVYIIVTTDEPGATPADLRLRVDIKPLVSVTPRLVQWTKTDGLVSRTVEIKRLGKAVVQIGEPKPTSDTVSVELKPGAEPDTWRLTLTPKSVDAPFTTKVVIPVTVGGRAVAYSVFAAVR